MHCFQDLSVCWFTQQTVYALHICRCWEKKRKKINIISCISFVPPGLLLTTNVLLLLHFSRVQKPSYTVTYIWPPLQIDKTEGLANDLKTTLILFIKDNLTAIHPGSSESPINNTSCQRAKLKLKRGHCSKSGLKLRLLIG